MTERNPDLTRQKILEVAADEIYRCGFQAASLAEILRRTGLSKGAFYHHFATKHELGLAVLDEVFARWHRDSWDCIVQAADPLLALVHFLRQGPFIGEAHGRPRDERVRHGCPLNNLTQEMVPLDDDFRRHVGQVLEAWRRGVAAGLGRSQELGTLEKGVDVDRLATFVVAAVEGAITLTKSSQDAAVFTYTLAPLADYLETLGEGRPGLGQPGPAPDCGG